MKILLISAIFTVCLICEISAHGMMLNPAGRSSRWRYDGTAPINYDDNGLNCGGYSNQWNTWGGKCGLCGDPYQNTVPRRNELGGSIGGNGVIVASYVKGSDIEVTVKITANHMGKFIFDLCNLDSEGESDGCFEKNRILTVNGQSEFPIGSSPGDYKINLRLPTNLTCARCVLRWTYVAGNNWGWCGDGTGRLGCGPQETFRSCADVKITSF